MFLRRSFEKCAQSLILSQARSYCRLTCLLDGTTMESHDRRAGHGSHPSNWTEKASNDDSIHCERLLRRGKSKPPPCRQAQLTFFFRISKTCKHGRNTWPTFQCRNPVFQARSYPRVGLRCVVGRLKQNYIFVILTAFAQYLRSLVS